LTVVLRALFVLVTNKLSLVLCLIMIATASKQISVRRSLLPSAITTIREEQFYSTNSTTTTLKQMTGCTPLLHRVFHSHVFDLVFARSQLLAFVQRSYLQYLNVQMNYI
ncbi:hypothetical protein T02_11192, partial [Trichinella nativa]